MINALLASDALDPTFRSHLRLVRADEADAAYVAALRNDTSLNAHLNTPKTDAEAQQQWLQSYKAREELGEEFYYVVMHEAAESGLVRMYDFRTVDGHRSFSWGSWIIPEPRPRGLVTFSAILIYEAGFDALGFERSDFEVRRANQTVIAFHERAGARRVSENHQDAFFTFGPDAYAGFRKASETQIREHRVRWAAERFGR